MKARFCPSPTGFMHLGNARTALFNTLLAAGSKGVFLLRIEDTDQARSTAEYAEGLLHDLRWLGLQWQEGPEAEGAAGPYWQSQRQAIYDQYYQKLEQLGYVYPCFCSDQQLAIARKVQLAAGQPPRYTGVCRKLTADQVAEKLAQGEKPTLRFKIPLNETIRFTDLVRGEQVFKTQDIGDFIIRRADGTASFLYCNIIDDTLMGVTHALRGEDHLTNTPRQLLIAQALALAAPVYGHISMIVGPDGSPLSKRHGSKSIKDLREAGYLPIALANYMARLGHYYESNKLMTLAELAAAFNTQALGSAPARFDASQLLHYQKEAVHQADNETLWQWMGEHVHALVPQQHQAAFLAVSRSISVFPEDALHWAQIIFNEQITYSAEATEILRQAVPDFFVTAKAALNQAASDYHSLCAYLQNTLKVKGKALFQPLRVALTGELYGPEMELVLNLLGAKRAAARMEQVAQLLETQAN